MVREAIKSIKNSAGKGEGSIHPIILKSYAEELAFPLTKSYSTKSYQPHANNIAIDTIANNNQLDIVYADMSRAFDIVAHYTLLRKLADMEFSKPLLRIIWSFLTDREQYVKCGRFNPNRYKVPSGVFQGSHCSPKFFVAFINNLSSYMENAIVIIFADDVKLLMQIKDYSDMLKLQEDLNNLYQYCLRNGKCIHQRKITLKLAIL